MTAFSHATVMLEQAVDLLAPHDGGLYCDGTLGGGGHAARILALSAPGGRLIGLDRDPSALEAAGARLGAERVTLVHARFSEIARVLSELGAVPLDGVLVDLGVSSPQFDRPERGFSFRAEGPLDMRMDPSRGETAAELIARLSEHELTTVLRNYGEERFSGRIASAMKQAMADHKLHTTTDLATLVARAVPRREPRIDPATRTFQALRIAVNDELGELDTFLTEVPPLLRAGGRVVVITFHSLEDRLVKHAFRAEPALEPLTKKPLLPTERELLGKPPGPERQAPRRTEEGSVRMTKPQVQVRPAALVVIAGTLACTLSLGYVWVRLQLVDLGYQMGRESRSAQKLDDENRRLRVLVESLKSPARIERMATGALKMTPPQVTEIRSISTARADETSDSVLARR